MAIKQKYIRYGGAVCGKKEQDAIFKSVKKSIKSGNWQQGEEGKLFEQESSKFLGVKYGILANSGSSAGLLALSALELPKGSEVIIPAITFPTIFNIILQCGLVPVVVDVNKDNFTIDTDKLKKSITKKTKAMIVVHALGIPCDMISIMRIAKEHNIKVIEDNCDGWGSKFNNRLLGSFGDISFTSFHAAHIISMGVGGGVYTNDKNLATKIRQYRDWGRLADTTKPHKAKNIPKGYNPRFVYDKIGYNFQVLELQCAMGRVQLRQSKKIKEARQRNYTSITNAVRCTGKFKIARPFLGSDVCWFSIPLTYLGKDLSRVIKKLEDSMIETRPMFAGNIIKHPAYKGVKYIVRQPLDMANRALTNSFWISCHPRLSSKDINHIIKTLKEI